MFKLDHNYEHEDDRIGGRKSTFNPERFAGPRLGRRSNRTSERPDISFGAQTGDPAFLEILCFLLE
jgi:hypothetical protein